ncbi:MAG: hypothetical protein AB7F86_16795 [Bdellovibrionales bacterium]
MTEIEAKPKRKRKPITDRIVLNQASMETVANVVGQIEQAFGGLVKLGTKDVVNYLLQSRSSALTASDLNQIRAQFFDEIRAAQWALRQVKEAKERGESVSLTEVLARMALPKAKVSNRKTALKRKEKHDEKTPTNDVKAPDLSNDVELKG